jgi:hypothetical protein
MFCGFFYVGTSFHACFSVGRHIVALEEDKEVFFALLVSMVHFPVVASTPQP